MSLNCKSIRRALTWSALILSFLTMLSTPRIGRADVVPAGDSPCAMTGTFAALEATGTCSIGDKTYSNFTLSSSTVAPGSVTYQTVNRGIDANGFTFQLTNFNASGSGSADMTLGFDVTAPAALIIDAQLQEVGSVLNGGTATIGEVLCLGGPVIGCPAADTKTLMTSWPTQPTDTINFSPVTELGVEKDISAVGNGGSGFASISIITETISQVPEPGFYGVIAAGMAGILMFAKRRRTTA
jgi:hypothetical protein